MKLTQKLLGFMNRVFSKDPDAFLALRLQYRGGMTWATNNGILTTVVSGGIGQNLTIDLSRYTVRQLVSYLAAQPGYSIPYADISPLADLSALVLIHGGADIATSDGDHIYGYTSLLWSYVDAGGQELQSAATQIDQMLLQMDTHTASAEWLDELGSYYGIPRDPAGSIVAPAVTNLIRNNTMVGAVAGSPGTIPMNWSISTANGLARQIVGIGVQNGITYVDIRHYGTPTSTSAIAIYFDTYTSTASSVGQVWAGSAYVALVGGTMTSVTGFGFGFRDHDALGNSTAAATLTTISLTPDLTRYFCTHTVTAAGTVFTNSALRWVYANTTTPVDFTLRIGLPQLEIGSVATAVIRTSGQVVTRPPVYGAEADAQYAPRIITEVLLPRNNNVAIELALEKYTGQPAQVVDVVEYGSSSGSFTYNSVYTFNSAKQYNSSTTPIYGKFDVIYSYDLLGGTDQTSFAGTVRSLIERLRASGTHLRAMSLQTSAIADTAKAPTDGGDLKYVGALALGDSGPAPGEQMGILSSALAALADAVVAAADGVNLTVTYGTQYGGARQFNGAIKYANTGTPVAESF